MTQPEAFRAFGPDLVTVADLLRKLEHDFQRLKQNPRDTYAAFDFFVTAEHLPDWIGNVGVKHEIPLLRVVSHLAAGAKHFMPRDKRHKSVQRVEVQGGCFQSDMVQTDAFQVGALVIELQGKEAAHFGMEIGVLELAELVLRHWQDQIQPNSGIQPAR